MVDDRARAEFEELYRHAYPRLVAAVTLLTGSRAVAEDAVQEAFARAWNRWDRLASYDQPQALLTALEGGAATLLFSSGMAAAAAVFQSLPRDSHVVAPRVMYWGLRSWLKNFAEAWGIAVDFVDATSLDALRQAVRPGRTRLIWIETPANPLWSVTDIAGSAEIAHSAGALLAVDGTAATPRTVFVPARGE